MIKGLVLFQGKQSTQVIVYLVGTVFTNISFLKINAVYNFCVSVFISEFQRMLMHYHGKNKSIYTELLDVNFVVL